MMRRLLFPLAWIYRLGVTIRNLCYDRGIFRVRGVSTPVVSVGNLSVGGTGKTPVIRHLYSRLQSEGYRPAILTRGYKRAGKEQQVIAEEEWEEVSVRSVGDEPAMLSMELDGGRIVVNADRVAGAHTAMEELYATLLLLDDGYQHRRLGRDVDIVVIPAEDTYQPERVLPAGRLREPWSSLARATHILLAGQGESVDWDKANAFVKRYTHAPVYKAVKRNAPRLVNPQKGEVCDLSEEDTPIDAGVIAGIGNPRSFLDGLDDLSLRVVGKRVYSDHYPYPRGEQEKILGWIEEIGADILVMTAKDYIKWDAELRLQYPVYYLPLEIEIAEEFYTNVQNAFSESVGRRL